MNIQITPVPKNIQWLDIIMRDFVNRHYELNDYGFGNRDQINSSELEYPHLWLHPTRTTVISNDQTIKNGFSAQELEIDVIVSDILRADKDNMVETISDVNEIALSAITELSNHPYYVKNKIKVINDITIENEWEENDAIVNRCVASITIRMPFLTSYCELPIDYEMLPPFTPPSLGQQITFCEAVKSCVGYDKITITEAQLYDMFNNPIELIQGQTGKQIVIENVIIDKTGATGYLIGTSDASIFFSYTNATTFPSVTRILSQRISDDIYPLSGSVGFNPNASVYLTTGRNFFSGSEQITAGTGDITLYYKWTTFDI